VIIWGNQFLHSNTRHGAITLWESLNQSESHRVPPWDWSWIVALLLILITSIWRHDIDRGMPSRGGYSRFVRLDYGTLDVRRQVSSWHSVHLGVIGICCGGNRNLGMLPPGPAPHRPALTLSFVLGGSCSGLDPCAGIYIRTAKSVRGIPVVTLSYLVFIPWQTTHHMHDPGSIVPHIWRQVFIDNQMLWIKYNYYINNVSKDYDDSQVKQNSRRLHNSTRMATGATSSLELLIE
jgi:hypothetical protein